MALKIGILLNYGGQEISMPVEAIQQAEALGYESVWVPEAYASDAVSMSSWILANTKTMKVGTAIMQIPARTPANAAQTIMTLQQLSGGRFIPGFGPSGPQVVEGWHGVSAKKPLVRSREYIQIIRKLLAREKSQFEGEVFRLPYDRSDAVGLGKSIRCILRGEPQTPIFSASFTPAGLRMAGEIADGVIPPFLHPEKFDLLSSHLQQGLDKRADGRQLSDFAVSSFVPCQPGDDIAACRQPIKEYLALYVGGMGARSKNYYNDFVSSMGYADEAAEIQDLFLAGRKEEAANAVPDALVDDVSLVGDEEQLKAGLARWKKLAEGRDLRLILMNTNARALERFAAVAFT